MKRLFLGALLVTASCRRDHPVGESRSGTATPHAATTSTSSAVSPDAAHRWDDALGAVLATPASDGVGVLLFARDTVLGPGVDVELFTHDEHTQRAVLAPSAAVGSCGWQRSALVAHDGGTPAPVTWSLALAPGVATPLGIDAVGDLPPRDSSALVISVSKLVSALPDDSLSASFRGLPVIVRDAWKSRLPGGAPVIVAITTRTLNVESNPRSEIVVLIAEADGAGWKTVFTRRDAGPEESVDGADLLAALVLSDGRPVFAFARETDHGVHLDFVERVPSGDWRLRWTTTALPCAREQSR